MGVCTPKRREQVREAGGWARSPGREALALAVAWSVWWNRFGLKRLESGWADGNDELGWGWKGLVGWKFRGEKKAMASVSHRSLQTSLG